jgi:uncharacterized protein YjiS (DUF1127 family)
MLSGLKLSSNFAPLGHLVASIAVAIGRGLQQAARAYKNRGDAAMLARLDERMLADIGLTRSDLRDAYAEPLWRDPTSILASRAGERRANRRRIVFGLAGRAPLSPSIVPDNGFAAPAPDRPARYVV